MTVRNFGVTGMPLTTTRSIDVLRWRVDAGDASASTAR